MSASKKPSDDALREEILRLRPWHLEVQVTPELSTAAADPAQSEDAEDQSFTFVNPREGWQRLMKTIYPDGLDGRSFLDCACNAGGYSFWAKELGASRCFGFDVRDHWIEQAKFLQRARTEPADGISFDVCDLYDLPERLGDDQFDITLFKGIFYHLPDPVSGLSVAAERTRELLIVNTATRADSPDGFLAVAEEPVDPPMSGVYGLNWLPTGPKVLERILKHMGFPATRVLSWNRKVNWTNRAKRVPRGRVGVMAARDPALFEAYDAARPKPPDRAQAGGRREGR